MMKGILYAIAGGVMIGIGGTVYLACGNAYVGALLFSVGLLTICEFQLGLYTGKVGYLILRKGRFYTVVLQALVGNVLGTGCAGLALSFARGDLQAQSAELCAIKMTETPLQTLVLSFFCGILMFIAVHLFQREGRTSRYLGIFLAVPTFILAGFEHSVANMFYLFLGRVFSFRAVAFVVICIVGNGLGGVSAALFSKQLSPER